MKEGYKSIAHFNAAMTPERSKFLVDDGDHDAAYWASSTVALCVMEREDAITHWGCVSFALSSRAYASGSQEQARRDLAFFDQVVNDYRARHGDGDYLPKSVQL